MQGYASLKLSTTYGNKPQQNSSNTRLCKAEIEQLMVMNHKKAVASVNAYFNEVKPRPTPVWIYVENYNNSQQDSYISHHKAYVEDTHVNETTTFPLNIH